MRKPTDSPLRQLRKARTITQVEFARLVGITQSMLSRYESGAVVPPKPTQELMATILGGRVNELFPEHQEVA